MHEHWSLVLEDPSKANIQAYFQGNFKTAGLKICCERLTNLSGDGYTYKSELNCFDKIRKHRNKLIHFYNKEYKSPSNPIPEVILEQFSGFLLLKKLFEDRWKSHFHKYIDRLSNLEQELKTHREFLQAKYDSLKNILKGKASAGKVVLCENCNFISDEILIIDEPLYHFKCQVCETSSIKFKYECNGSVDGQCDEDCDDDCDIFHSDYDCTEVLYLSFDNHNFECPKCNKDNNASEEIYYEYLTRSIDNSTAMYDGGYDDDQDMVCPECSSFGDSIIIRSKDSNYLCVNCNMYYKPYETSHCDYCGTKSLGTCSSDASYVFGCSECDGQISRID